jgi:hypothetical protein
MKRERMHHSLVYAGEGRDSIDIVPYLVYEQDENASLPCIVVLRYSSCGNGIGKSSSSLLLCLNRFRALVRRLFLTLISLHFYRISVLVRRF